MSEEQYLSRISQLEKEIEYLRRILDNAEEMIEDTKNLVQTLEKCGIKIGLRDHMHEHFAIIDSEIVWYGSMNFLSRAKDDDNLIRVKSKDAAQELMELTFGY